MDLLRQFAEFVGALAIFLAVCAAITTGVWWAFRK